MQTIGFIGLGIMGKPMAANLLGAGYPFIVYDIVPEAVAETVAKGAKAAKSPADVARQVDVAVSYTHLQQRGFLPVQARVLLRFARWAEQYVNAGGRIHLQDLKRRNLCRP